MTQSHEEDAIQRMAVACQAQVPETLNASRAYSAFHRALSDHVEEMLPVSPVTVVIEREGDKPVLLALDGTELHIVTMADRIGDFEPATVIDRLEIVDPGRASVECETRYSGHRLDGVQCERNTTWRFQIRDATFAIETFTDRSRNWIEDGEVFSRALANVLGWQRADADSGQIAGVA